MNPESYMLKNYRRQGQYQGCFASSHWGGRRVQDRWDVLVKYAPALAKRLREVPNILRPALGIEVPGHHSSMLFLSASNGFPFSHQISNQIVADHPFFIAYFRLPGSEAQQGQVQQPSCNTFGALASSNGC